MCPFPRSLLCLYFYQFLKVRPPQKRQRIYYQDAIERYAEPGTPFTDRISVNISMDTGMAMLTINEVRLQDELEYICVIRALTEGEGKGSTKLKVFGKKAYSLTLICSSFLKPVEERHKKNGENA